jgi:radical SAM superfamily enzyme YgiQ (UPF0313 family)
MRALLVESGVMTPENFVYQCYPPHGLMYLASFARKHQTGLEFQIFDMMEKKSAPEDILKILGSFTPDLVAIHAMSFQASSMHALAKIIKKWDSQCLVAIGGPHPSAASDLVLADENIDIIAIGEGERTLLDIIARVQSKQELTGIPGTALKKDGKIEFSPKRDFIDDLDEIPFPAWDLIDLTKYFTDVMLNQNDITNRREVTTIFTSRACPFGCIFCHNMFGKKFRARSVENVLDEMETLQKDYGITELHIIDDCFNCIPKRAIEILEGIKKRGLDFKIAFPNGVRGDRLPDELLDLMRETGVYKINIGIESGSPVIQKMIKKGIALDTIKDGIKRAAERNIFTHGFFMLGFPGETKEQMMETIDFACSTDLCTAGFAILSPFPGTRVHEMAVESGTTVEFDPDDTSYQKVTHNLSAVDNQTLIKMHKLAHRKFYGSPKRIFQIITTMPRPLDTLRVGLKHVRLKFL